MTFGHFGLAAAVRGRWKESSLLWLLPASLAPDLVDLIMAGAGICNPFGLYSHTIPAVALLALAIGGAAFLAGRRSPGGRSSAATNAGACVVVVLLHPVLDLFTGVKLFWPGGSLVGMGLYARPLVDFLLETAVVVAGWLVMRRERSGPRWATTLFMLGLAVVLQATASLARPWHKPNACGPELTPPV